MIEAAGLHVGLVPDGEGRARAALVSVGPPGFFHVVVANGRPIAEQPLTPAEDAGVLKPASDPPTSARRPADPRPNLGAAPAPRESATPAREAGASAPAPERAPASAGEPWATVATSRRLITTILQSRVPAEATEDALVQTLSPYAGTKGRAIINLPSRALAGRLAREARAIAQVDSYPLDIREAAGRLGSELAVTLAQSNASQEASHEPPERAKEGATMAPKSKSAGKKSGTKAASSKGKKRTQTKAAEESTSTRRKITDDIVERAIDMREDGATWVEVEEETGFNGAQLRPHIAKVQGAGVKIAKTPKAIAAAREEGLAWYTIAEATGLSVAEVKEKAEEGGADVSGRVYRSSEEEDEKPKGKGKAGKGKTTAGKRRGRKAKEDPSEEE